MIVVTDQVIEDMANAIVREVAPEKIILFGSRASGGDTPESDVDLIVIEREPFGPSRSRAAELRRIRRALSVFRIAKDILVYSADEAAYWTDSLNHVLARALREGQVLYARP